MPPTMRYPFHLSYFVENGLSTSLQSALGSHRSTPRRHQSCGCADLRAVLHEQLHGGQMSALAREVERRDVAYLSPQQLL